MEKIITIIGGGLAGSEAAWQIARRGIKVRLYEMRPKRNTPVHITDLFGELVCSNSLRSNSVTNAVGLLKEELRILDSLIIKIADETKVPAGSALAVDRLKFAERITYEISNNSNVEIIREEVTGLPLEGLTIIATGPLTSEALSLEIKKITGNDYFYFYDAIAPIVDFNSIDQNKVFRASRYDKGDTADYLNCPFTKEEYYNFVDALLQGEKYPLKEFEKGIFFDGCMPIEVMAERGRDTLLFGPMKPVGLVNPVDNQRPYAVMQLRQDNLQGSLFNLVGFQTRLLWKEQDRIFRMIPGLENVEFIRYGSMHRNTFINSPYLLNNTNQFKTNPELFFAGQLTGVEGYVESIASGLISGINASNFILNKEIKSPPSNTAIGALLAHISDSKQKHFQPMNINFGIISMEDSTRKIRNRDEKNKIISDEAIKNIIKWKQNYF